MGTGHGREQDEGMIEPPPIPTGSAGARLLLLPEEITAMRDDERPRVRRYRLSRMATGSPPMTAPSARRAGDYEHLRRLYD